MSTLHPAAQAFIALGSNMDNPATHVCSAMEEISAADHSQVIARSSLYQSPAIGPGKQDDFINAVVSVSTSLQPLPLLDWLQQLEQAHGRERIQRWGPRTLDLDILLYAGQQIEHPRLTVPHPEMLSRAFVVFPLLEIAPQLTLPNGQPLATATGRLATTNLLRLPSNTDEPRLSTR